MFKQLRITERLDGLTIRFPSNGMPGTSRQGQIFQGLFGVLIAAPILFDLIDIGLLKWSLFFVLFGGLGIILWRAHQVRLHLSPAVLTLSTPSLRKSIPLEDIDAVTVTKDHGMGLYYVSVQQGTHATPVESLLRKVDVDWLIETLEAAIASRKAELAARGEGQAAAPPAALQALISSAQQPSQL